MNGDKLFHSSLRFGGRGVMSTNVVALEGVIENGQIRLMGNIRLPEGTRVFVVVPDIQVERVPRVVSPHLVNKEQAKDFVLEVVEKPSDAGV